LNLNKIKINDRKDVDEQIKCQNENSKNNLIKRMLTFKEYKHSLEEQIKNKRKVEFMNVNERKINKNLL